MKAPEKTKWEPFKLHCIKSDSKGLRHKRLEDACIELDVYLIDMMLEVNPQK